MMALRAVPVRISRVVTVKCDNELPARLDILKLDQRRNSLPARPSESSNI